MSTFRSRARRCRLLGVVALSALALASCGDEQDQEATVPGQAITSKADEGAEDRADDRADLAEVAELINSNNPEWCLERTTQRFLNQVFQGSTQKCVDSLKITGPDGEPLAEDDVRQPPLKVLDERVNGAKAVLIVTGTDESEKPTRGRLVLVKEGGIWKIDAAPDKDSDARE